jgi:hypothetical protein
MKRLLAKIEALMAAVAFAEEGEVETARQIMAEAEVAPDETPARPTSGLYPPRAANSSRA